MTRCFRWILALALLLSMSGCAGLQLGRSFVNVPLFEEAGDLSVGAGLSNQGASIQAGYAVNDWLGTFGSLGYAQTPDAWSAGLDVGAGPYRRWKHFAAEGFLLVGTGTGDGTYLYHRGTAEDLGRASHVDMGVQANVAYVHPHVKLGWFTQARRAVYATPPLASRDAYRFLSGPFIRGGPDCCELELQLLAVVYRSGWSVVGDEDYPFHAPLSLRLIFRFP